MRSSLSITDPMVVLGVGAGANIGMLIIYLSRFLLFYLLVKIYSWLSRDNMEKARLWSLAFYSLTSSTSSKVFNCIVLHFRDGYKTH